MGKLIEQMEGLDMGSIDDGLKKQPCLSEDQMKKDLKNEFTFGLEEMFK